MTGSMGMGEFFRLEAGEYLDRLEGLTTAPRPVIDEFVRLARALRGSALMANESHTAKVAQGLEWLARAIREGRRAWDEANRQLVTRALDDLRVFVRHAGHWPKENYARAEVLAAELEEVAGRRTAQIRAVEREGLDAGARAFIAREGSGIASALDRAAAALRLDPAAHEALQTVLRAMQSLRGLAVIQDLAPFPDLLEGIDRAANAVLQTDVGNRDVSEIFAAAARAVARAAREIASLGRPEPDAPEAREFADRLGELLDDAVEAVPIERLFYDDDGPHIVEQGTAPPGASLGTLELVSYGEHLRQAADELERAVSVTQRELRAHALGTTLRLLAAARGNELNHAVAAFATAAREAVARGLALDRPRAFAAELRSAGSRLAHAGGLDQANVPAAIQAVTERIETMVAAAAPRAEPTAGAPAAPAASNQPAATAEHATASRPTTQDRRLPDDAAGSALIRTVRSWQLLRRTRGILAADSLDELLNPPAAAHERADTDVVPIGSLLYRGERALERILELRSAALDEPRPSPDILEEIFDLVTLAFPGRR